jgi:hypothetical protein
MKKVKQLHSWGIYELSEKEKAEHGYNYAVIHPDVMGTGNVTARDTDMPMDTLQQAIEWVVNY